jgi:hypothetical protein
LTKESKDIEMAPTIIMEIKSKKMKIMVDILVQPVII